MKAVVQRVKSAKVTIDGKINGQIQKGLLVLLGITHSDDSKTIDWMCNKLLNLRIFNDDNDKMNLSVSDIEGGILVISNFTLYADARKGFRPSYTDAAPPEVSEPIYNQFMLALKNSTNLSIQEGIFGAMMDVELINDGPVTIIIEK